mgnify:CR=1 FL=1
MIEAAVAYYEATGKDAFLKIVSRFADVICEKFGPDEGQCHGYPGHPEVELALVKLYRATGEKRYLEVSKYFVEQRGVGENYFFQEEKVRNTGRFSRNSRITARHTHNPTFRSGNRRPPRDTQCVPYICTVPWQTWHTSTGDESLLDAAEPVGQYGEEENVHHRSIGSSGLLERFTTDYDLPNDCNYSESCASIGLALFGRRMAEITGEAKYMDVAETALYNTVLAGIAMDGRSFFYVNPLEVWPDNCLERTSKEHVKPVRQKWFGVACCPPNIARTLASLGQYLYGKGKDSLYINLYVSNEAQTVINGVKCSVKIDSGYLDDGTVNISLTRSTRQQEPWHLGFPAG